jgi:GTP-binding protein
VRGEPLRVEREDRAWRVRGRQAERAVATTNMDNADAVARLQRGLIAMGVEAQLEKAGARWGDEVRIGGQSFDFEPESQAGDAEATPPVHPHGSWR